MLKKDDPTKQLVYYQVISLGPTLTLRVRAYVLFRQAGIGTYTSNVLKTPIVESISKLLDEMVAWNLDEHIKGLSTLLASHRLTVSDITFQMDICF